jgi:hypothetical protein
LLGSHGVADFFLAEEGTNPPGLVLPTVKMGACLGGVAGVCPCGAHRRRRTQLGLIQSPDHRPLPFRPLDDRRIPHDRRHFPTVTRDSVIENQRG